MPADDTVRLVARGGKLVFVYDDALHARLSRRGEARIERASHVEPAATGGWEADMGPVGGPVLRDVNGNGFATRAEALGAERDWLRDHLRL